MKRPLYLPNEVKVDIQKHLDAAIKRAVDGYESAAEDEDVMTGHLGGLLRIGPQRVHVTQAEVDGDWSWSIEYHKFRGRGDKATESFVGADGILELQVRRPNGVHRKAALFQSKLD